MTSSEAFHPQNSGTLNEALSYIHATASTLSSASQQIDALGASFEAALQIETSLNNEVRSDQENRRTAELARSSLRLQFFSELPTARSYTTRRRIGDSLQPTMSSQFEVDSLATAMMLDATVLWLPLNSCGSRIRWGNNVEGSSETLSPAYVIGRKITSPNSDKSDALEDLLLAPAWERPYQYMLLNTPEAEKTGRPLPLRATVAMRSFDELEQISNENLRSGVISEQDYKRRRVENGTTNPETGLPNVSFITNGFMSNRITTPPYTTLVPKDARQLPKLPSDDGEKGGFLRKRRLKKVQDRLAQSGLGARFTHFSYGEALTDQVVEDFNVEMHTRKLAELFNIQQAYDATIGSASIHNS